MPPKDVNAYDKLEDGPGAETDTLIPKSEGQVAERAFKAKKDQIFALLCVSALVDTMGASLLAPAYAMAVSNAEGAVPPTGGVHPDAFPEVPLSFSLAVNVIGSANILGAVFSSLTMGPVSDKLGRKPLIIVGLLGGAVGYFLMYWAAAVQKSYVLFVLAMFVNGLFSGTKSVMGSYFADVYSPEEFGAKQPLFGMCMLTGGAAGGIFGGIVIAATGKLWIAAWGGVGASIFFAALVQLMMPGPHVAADAKKTDAPSADSEAPQPTTTTTVKRILLTCIIAGSIDSLGDEGNRFARSTIMPQSYPSTKDPSVMSLISSSNVLATAFCMFLVMGTQKKFGLAGYTVLGNACSAIVQFSLVLCIRGGPDYLPAYVSVWWLGQFFGFTSSMAQMILVGQTAPRAERGFWTGMSNAAGNFTKFIGPLLLSVLYGTENRGELALVVCGSISLVATILYLPLPGLVPAPSKLSPVLAKMSVYEKMSHVEFMQLSLQTRWMIDQKRNEAGLPAIMHGWGSYEEQRALLPSLIQNSLDDFAFLKGRMVDYLTSTTRLEELRGRFKKMDAKRQAEDYQVKHTAKQEEMGRWLGEYFDDAGYEGWEFYPELFKAMVMNAFPPIDELDAKAGSSIDSLSKFEKVQINFMSVMDQHLSTQLAKEGKNSAFFKAAVGPL